MTVNKEMVVLECYCCGVFYAVTTWFNAESLKSKRRFWCPNGHGQSYVESTDETHAKQLAEKQRSIDQLQADKGRLESELQTLKAKKTAKSSRKRGRKTL